MSEDEQIHHLAIIKQRVANYKMINNISSHGSYYALIFMVT